LIRGSHHILVIHWNNSLLFSVHGFTDLSQTEIHATQPIVPELNAFNHQTATWGQYDPSLRYFFR